MLIAIAGPSCSGKTTLARIIAAMLGAPLLHLDRHWLGHVERPVVSGHPSFERPDQYDGAALLELSREAVATSADVVVEGFLLFRYPGFLEMADKAIYLDVPHDVVAARRRARALAKAALDDVPGGRSESADAGWQAHGREEWLAYGAFQRDLPGVEVLPHGTLGDDATRLDAVARSIIAPHQDAMAA
jgi:hypothetical protein